MQEPAEFFSSYTNQSPLITSEYQDPRVSRTRRSAAVHKSSLPLRTVVLAAVAETDWPCTPATVRRRWISF